MQLVKVQSEQPTITSMLTLKTRYQIIQYRTFLQFDLVCDDSILATVASMFIFAGWIIGSVLFGFLSDRYGRKVAFLACVINITVVALAGAFVKSLWLFIVIRFFVGVGIGKILFL